METVGDNEQPAQSPHREPTLTSASAGNPNNNSDDEMFSPTSAAALALSTLHHFGDQQRPSVASLKGTRLFNSSETQSQEPPAPTEIPPQYYPSQPAYHAPPLHPSYYGHYGMWSRGNPNTPQQMPSVQVSPWSSYPYPSPPGYPMEPHPSSRGSTPTLGGPSPPPSHCSSACAPESMYYHRPHPPRSSPVAFVGPSPPMSRSNSFIPHHPPENPPTLTSEKPYSRAQSDTTLVTPTPKKAKVDPQSVPPKGGPGYSRKKKSLGILAENFLKTYENLPCGSIVIVDEAAIKLGVERRRIYDVVNILESISLVCKKHKNTYTWMGMDHLDAVFGRMQAEALEEHPEDAKEFLGVTGLSPREPPSKPLKGREFKSLARLSQDFLQVFLVGHKTLSLPDASDKIQGTTSMEELVAMGQKNKKFLDEKELRAAAARGLKTKIRRLYDIANVFLSVGLLEKVDGSDATRRPNFSWSYRLSAKQIYDLHQAEDKNQVGPKTVGYQEEDSSDKAVMRASTPPSSHQHQLLNSSCGLDAPCSTAELECTLQDKSMTTDTTLSQQQEQKQQVVLAVTPCSSTNTSANSSPLGCEGHVAI